MVAEVEHQEPSDAVVVLHVGPVFADVGALAAAARPLRGVGRVPRRDQAQNLLVRRQTSLRRSGNTRTRPSPACSSS